MDKFQETYSQFISKVCKQYACMEAAEPLTAGFKAYCEAEALDEGLADTAKKWVAPAALAAGIGLAGTAVSAAHNFDRDTRNDMYDKHWQSCGMMPNESEKTQSIGDMSIDDIIEHGYQMRQQLNDNGASFCVKLANQIYEDTKAVENAPDADAKMTAAKKLNADTRQAARVIYMAGNGGKCLDGHHVQASPKSTLRRTWSDD